MKFNLSMLSIKKLGIKKIPWMLASRAFLVILCLILLDIALGVFLFYQYVMLPTTQRAKGIEGTIKFEYTIYDSVLKAWDTKAQVFQPVPDKKYTNPFSKQ